MIMKIETKEFILRNWDDSDAVQLALIANKNIFDNLCDAFPFPYSFEDAQKYIEQSKHGSHSRILFAIEVAGIVKGSIGAFFKEDVYKKNVEIGYYLAEDVWGKGIMTAVITVFVTYIFGNYNIDRIFAQPFSKNIASRRVLEKVGFRLEGLLKNSVIKNDKVENSCIMRS